MVGSKIFTFGPKSGVAGAAVAPCDAAPALPDTASTLASTVSTHARRRQSRRAERTSSGLAMAHPSAWGSFMRLPPFPLALEGGTLSHAPRAGDVTFLSWSRRIGIRLEEALVSTAISPSRQSLVHGGGRRRVGRRLEVVSC